MMDVVETPRLRLRRYRPDDADRVAPIYADPETTRYAGGVRTPEMIAERIANVDDHWRAHGFGPWVVALPATDEPIGHCGLRRCQSSAATPDEIELLYLLAKPHWGQGLASEAASMALAVGFGVWGFARIMAMVHPDNVASVRVLEKLGMTCERSVEDQWGPALYYGLERSID
jgi:RimJ/RimL family protein N-acetyltransferase